jgi:hypothetical protein
MKLELIKTTYADLPDGARAVLALKGEPFYAIRYLGPLYVNKDMPGFDDVVAAIEVMWKENCAYTDTVDKAYETISNVAGKQAAEQIACEWCSAAKQSREEEEDARAMEWVINVYEKMGVDTWDELCGLGYDSSMIDHGLWRAFSALHDKHRDDPRYKDWSLNARRASFLYGFLLGKATANKAEREVAE